MKNISSAIMAAGIFGIFIGAASADSPSIIYPVAIVLGSMAIVSIGAVINYFAA